MDFDSLLADATDSLLIKPDMGLLRSLGKIYSSAPNA